MGLKSNDAAGYQKLETLARHHLKVPLKKEDRGTGYVNINRFDPTEYDSEMQVHGIASEPSHKIMNVIRHDYLRKSMVDRIQRKSLLR